MPKTFGRALSEARHDSGLSLDRVAAASGLTGNYLRDLEKDRRSPSNDAVRRIASALGVRAGGLLEAAMSGRDAITLDASCTDMHRSVAHRLAIAWDLMTDAELMQLDQVLDSMRLHDSRSTP